MELRARPLPILLDRRPPVREDQISENKESFPVESPHETVTASSTWTDSRAPLLLLFQFSFSLF